MKNSRKFFVSDGFTLVEVMVTVAVLGVVSLGVTQLMQNMSKSTKTMSVKTEISDLWYTTQLTLRNQAGCTNSFQGANPVGAGSTVNQIISGDNVVMLTRLQDYGSLGGLVTLNDIKIYDVSASVATHDTIPTPAKVSLTFTRKGTANAAYGPQVTTKTMDVLVLRKVADGGNVTKCYAAEDQLLAAVCTSLGGAIGANGKCNNISIDSEPTPGNAITSTSNLKINSSLGVGTAASAGVGDIGLSRDLTVGRNTSITGSAAVGTSLAVGTSAAVGTSLAVGTNLTVSGSGTLMTVPVIESDTDMVNVAWVRNRIAETLAPDGATASQIGLNILDNLTGEKGITAIQRDLCARIQGPGNAAATVLGSWNAGTGKCETNIVNCSKSGSCTNVYATNKVMAGSFCDSAGANCYTKFESKICTGQHSVMVGISGGSIICANKYGGTPP